MSGGDEQPDEAADEPADRSGNEADDPAVDGDEEPVDDADRDRPDSPHRDPHTADDDVADDDVADETGADVADETGADGNDTDDDEEATPGVGSGGSTEDADGSADVDTDVDTDGDTGDDTRVDDTDDDAGMPDWEEKQWGPLEQDVDDAGEDEDERPYDPAFDDTDTDYTVASAELDAADDGGTDGGNGEDGTDGDEVSSDGDGDQSGTIEAVDRDEDVDEEGAPGETGAVPIERFDPEAVGLTTEADDEFDTAGGVETAGTDALDAGAADVEAADAAAQEGAASDGGTVAVGEDNTIGGAADEYDGGFGGFRDGPEYDQEMPLADHIEEMMTRLLTVIVVMAVVSAPAFLFADAIINFVWDSILGAAGSEAKPHVYRPLSLVLARLKTATLAGFIVALPVFVYETYRFMRPGLYPKERRYYLAAVPTSLVLASVGVLFAFYLVLPAIFVYFVTYSKGAAVIAFGLTDTYGLMLTMMGFFALIFQIPLFIMLAIMMGLTSRQWLAERRILFWGAFAGLSAMFAFDPTGMAPIIVALTMIVLFEGTLFLLRWVERGRAFFARRGGDPDSDV